jgi:hypothetical protein
MMVLLRCNRAMCGQTIMRAGGDDLMDMVLTARGRITHRVVQRHSISDARFNVSNRG